MSQLACDVSQVRSTSVEDCLKQDQSAGSELCYPQDKVSSPLERWTAEDVISCCSHSLTTPIENALTEPCLRNLDHLVHSMPLWEHALNAYQHLPQELTNSSSLSSLEVDPPRSDLAIFNLPEPLLFDPHDTTSLADPNISHFAPYSVQSLIPFNYQFSNQSQEMIEQTMSEQAPPNMLTDDMNTLFTPNQWPGGFEHQESAIHEPTPSFTARHSLLSMWSETNSYQPDSIQSDESHSSSQEWTSGQDDSSHPTSDMLIYGAFPLSSTNYSLERLSMDASSIFNSELRQSSQIPSSPTSQSHSTSSGHCLSTSSRERHRRASLIPNFGSSMKWKPGVGPLSHGRLARETRHSSVDHVVSTIAIPSPPRLFSELILPSNVGSAGRVTPPSSLTLPAADEEPAPEDSAKSKAESPPESSAPSKANTPNKAERVKRKRMHVCKICGKDFNRPSALLLHSNVHTGERTNFCNVCGRSFSNLSNLRRHQRQLHVLESQLPLPEIPPLRTNFIPYDFGTQTRF